LIVYINQDFSQEAVPASLPKALSYIQKILASHGRSNCNPAVTPADPHVPLGKSSEAFEATGIDWQRYK